MFTGLQRLTCHALGAIAVVIVSACAPSDPVSTGQNPLGTPRAGTFAVSAGTTGGATLTAGRAGLPPLGATGGTPASVPNPGAAGRPAPIVGGPAGSIAPPIKQPPVGAAGTVAPPPPTNMGAAGAANGTGGTSAAGTDFTKAGPFPTMTINNTGPDGMYTMIRPTTLGQNGFKHPPLTWGNGVTTTPATYPILFSTIASNGFVIIASNDSAVTAAEMTSGLDWLIAQNTTAGSELNGMLDVTKAVSMGYSLGGGAALTAGAHANVVCTIAMHPAPGGGALHGPVLLFTGTADTVVDPSLVMASYSGLTVPALLATLTGATHFEPVLSGGQELGPSIAWLRLWIFNDDSAKPYFYGTDCTLCKDPWSKITNAAWK
jgi:hypothetical protein